MKFRHFVTLLICLFVVLVSVAQEPFSVQIEPLTIANAPNIHSFSWGTTNDGKWVIVGGRIDGLHQRQPNASFLENDNNKSVYIIDPEGNQTWSTTLSGLQASIFEQLQSTNQEFIQRDNTLYIIGGYGYSATFNDHVTFANLTAIDLDGLASAVINGTSITSFFRQISDANLAVTGGQLGLLNDVFYLCGGQYFEGRYNPMGPNQGPGFTQIYTEEIRKFEIVDDGLNLSIANYAAQNDINNLHRRDFNMAPQIFPNGDLGFTMFSGVFQHSVDLPWLNTIDVTSTGYIVNNSFNQYLSQYHSAKIPLYDTSNNTMHTLFFGGMSQYTLDVNDNLVQDDEIPFVKTISRVSRNSDGSMVEAKLDIEMPTLLGSGAEFIPLDEDANYLANEIVDLNSLPEGVTLIGHIFGGIESTQENIFFINDGTQSSASNLAFKVYINKTSLGLDEVTLESDNIFNVEVFPNPSKDIFSVDFFVPNTNNHELEVFDLLGRSVKSIEIKESIGRKTIELDLSKQSSGEYILSIKGDGYVSKKKIIKY